MRTRVLALALISLPTFSLLVACGGDDSSLTAPSGDAGPDVTSSPDASEDASDASLVNDASRDAAPPTDAESADADAGDTGDARDDDADASDAAPPTKASLALAAGTSVLGVTADDYVIYWSAADAGAGTKASGLGSLFAISGAGGAPQLLSAAVTTESVVVAGSTAVWLDDATPANAGACSALGAPLRSWSSAHGVVAIAPFAWTFGNSPIGVSTRPVWGDDVAVSADGSKVAYTIGCSGSEDAGTSAPLVVAVAVTDGTAPPLTAPLASGIDEAELLLNGGTVSVRTFVSNGSNGVSTGATELFAGAPLTETIPQLSNLLTDPTGTWAWEPAAQGMALVRTADGSTAFSDTTASTSTSTIGAFDPTASHFFYASSEGVKEVTLASPSTATVVDPRPLEVYGVTPNGEALLCADVASDGGTTYDFFALGPPVTAYPPPVANVAPERILPSSAVLWTTGGPPSITMFAQAVPGGPASQLPTVAGAYDVVPAGGSQVAVLLSSSVWIVDTAGKVSTFALSPVPDGIALTTPSVFSSPSGGLVAYESGGEIYAIPTL